MNIMPLSKLYACLPKKLVCKINKLEVKYIFKNNEEIHHTLREFVDEFLEFWTPCRRNILHVKYNVTTMTSRKFTCRL